MVERYTNSSLSQPNNVMDSSRIHRTFVEGPSPLDNLIKGLDGFVDREWNRLEKETVRKAQIAGSNAGLSPDFKTMESDTMYAEAYNRAGSEIFLNSTINSIPTILGELHKNPEYANNPTKMFHAVQDIKNEMMSNMPQSVVPDFSISFDARAQGVLAAAGKRRFDDIMSENKATFDNTEANLISEIKDAARSGDDKRLEVARNEYHSSVDGQVGLTLQPAEAEKRKMIIDSTIKKEAVIGDFLSVPDENKHAFMNSLSKTNIKELTGMEVEDIMDDMFNAWDAQDKYAKEEQAKIQLKTQEQIDSTLYDFIVSPSEDKMVGIASADGVYPEDIELVQSYLYSKLKTSSKEMTNRLDDLLYSGKYEDLKNELLSADYINDLSPSDGKRYMEAALANKNQIGFENDRAYINTLGQIKQDFSTSEGMSDEGKAIRQQIYDKMSKDYPRYLSGEASYDDVDPVRVYALKKANYDKIKPPIEGVKIKVSGGVVNVPKTYIDNPNDYVRDLKTGTMSGELKDHNVQKYIADVILKSEEENMKKAK